MQSTASLPASAGVSPGMSSTAAEQGELPHEAAAFVAAQQAKHEADMVEAKKKFMQGEALQGFVHIQSEQTGGHLVFQPASDLLQRLSTYSSFFLGHWHAQQHLPVWQPGLYPALQCSLHLEDFSVQAVFAAGQLTSEGASVCPAAARRKQQEYNKKVRGSHWRSRAAQAATLHERCHARTSSPENLRNLTSPVPLSLDRAVTGASCLVVSRDQYRQRLAPLSADAGAGGGSEGGSRARCHARGPGLHAAKRFTCAPTGCAG